MPGRTPPSDETFWVKAFFPREETDKEELHEGVTTRSKYTVPPNAKIVISVPYEEQMREKRQKQNESDTSDDEEGTTFKTTGYFNKAEQQIEKSLIAKNYIVLDRSKFEAKLRDQRAKEQHTRNYDGKRAEMEAARSRMDAGQLTEEQWAQEIRNIEKKYHVVTEDGGARSRGETKELVDNSELIRAAQEGEVRADYILQVNRFDTDALSDTPVYLVDRPEVENLCHENPGLRQALERGGVASISKPGFFGLLNAKLIEVQTGAIVWVGDHRVESINVLNKGLKIEVPVTKTCSNAGSVQSAIANHNAELKALHTECRTLKARVEAGQAPRHEIDGWVSQYRGVLATFTQKNESGPPSVANAPWTFAFDIQPIIVRPHLPTATEADRLRLQYRGARGDSKTRIGQQILRIKEFQNRHFSELAKLVAKELVSTMPAESARAGHGAAN